MLPYRATRQDSPRTSRARTRVLVLRHRDHRRRVRPSIHTLWHRLFSVVGDGESDVGGVHVCVHLDDGMCRHVLLLMRAR